ncbi:MAG: hypothetical protein V3W14_07315 [Candidatus Neomarinimicrobiota bacterium]
MNRVSTVGPGQPIALPDSDMHPITTFEFGVSETMWKRLKQTSKKKLAVTLTTGGLLAGLLVDLLMRTGMPEETASEVGDGLLALLLWVGQ